MVLLRPGESAGGYTLVALDDAGVRLRAPDGQTTLAANPKGMRTWLIYRDAILKTLQELDGRPKILVGHSMGGHLCIRLAARHPALLRRQGARLAALCSQNNSAAREPTRAAGVPVGRYIIAGGDCFSSTHFSCESDRDG
jgi:pimeloyl-ACP methyl ester carboxylesterase